MPVKKEGLVFSVRLFVFFDSLTCYGLHSTARKHISTVINGVRIYIFILPVFTYCSVTHSLRYANARPLAFSLLTSDTQTSLLCSSPHFNIVSFLFFSFFFVFR